MSDPLYDALNRFMGVVKDQIHTLREENRALRDEVRALQTETRAAPEPLPGPAGPQGEPGPAGERGEAGVGIAEMRQDGAELVVRLSDGQERRFSLPQGPRGEPGEPGPAGPAGERGERGAPGPQGEAGERGADGVASEEEIRSIAEAAVREAAALQMRGFYQGVYRTGEQYRQGQAATWDGSLWFALRDTTAKPGTDDSWQLAVKRGRDGRR